MTRQQDKGIAIALPEVDWVLEGVFLGGEGPDVAGAVVAPPHPLYGGSMDSPVVNELAHALKRAEYATVRFNWRGVGASGGQPSGEDSDADADYAASLAYLEETVSGPLLAAGYSFGAATAVRVAARSPRVRRLVLVAPPPALLDADALTSFKGSALVLAGEHDSFAPPAELDALLGDDPRLCLEVIPDADHFFMQGLVEVSRRTTSWFA